MLKIVFISNLLFIALSFKILLSFSTLFGLYGILIGLFINFVFLPTANKKAKNLPTSIKKRSKKFGWY